MYSTNISKRKHLLSGVAAAAIIAFSGSAGLAQSLVDWTGFYAGGHIGSGSADFVMTDLHDGDGSVGNSPSGILIGAQAGYNWQVNTFVLGLEADISTASWDEMRTFAPANASRDAQHELNLLATVRGRIGIPVDQTLFYATGGIAYADANFTATSPGGTLNSGSHNPYGSVFGLGAEYMMPDRSMTVRLEALYYNFDEETIFAGSDNPSGSSTIDDSVVVRLGINYYFSDRRLKRDIELVTRLENGLGLYRYRYMWGDQVYVGVMAQEVQEIMPEAVSCNEHGFLSVDYARLGLRFMTWQEWAGTSEFSRAA